MYIAFYSDYMRNVRIGIDDNGFVKVSVYVFCFYVYTPLSQWNILVDGKPNLRPFKIIGEIQKSLYKKAINGIGVITGGDFDLDLLTTESSSYLVEFGLDVFT